MLLSLALIITIGLILGELFHKFNLPGFLGMILTGILLGPYVFNLIDGSILEISSDLRKISLVVILLRAGLSLNIDDLKRIGKPAFLLSFIPASIEIIIVILLAPLLFGITYLEAAILGSVLAAVSPAVIVPKMIDLMDKGFGHEKRVPHLVMASATVDDIYVIVLFTSFMSMYASGSMELSTILSIPVAIVLGIIAGVFIGFIFSWFFNVFRVRDTIKTLLLLSVSFLILFYEPYINEFVSYSALLSIMVIGITFLNKSKTRALRLRVKFSKVWVFAELVLFVLVGAAVDVRLAIGAGALALVLLIVQLIGRIIGVQCSLIKTNYNLKERSFVSISYIPKATVQAAIGAIPLMAGVEHGELILALAVLSIIITAPLGAIGIQFSHKKLLDKSIEN